MDASTAKTLLGRVDRWSTTVTPRLSHIVEHHCKASHACRGGSYFTDVTGTKAYSVSEVIQHMGMKIVEAVQCSDPTFKADPRSDQDVFLIVKQMNAPIGIDPRARVANPASGLLNHQHGVQGPQPKDGNDCTWLVCVMKKEKQPGPTRPAVWVDTAYPATQLYVQSLPMLM